MSSWTSGQVITEGGANQKFVLIQAAAPSNSYEGQMWVCTSSDPPLLKVYDDTNAAWMERRQIEYESITEDFDKKPDVTPHLFGTLVVQYNSGTGKTYLYAYSQDTYGERWVARGDT